VRLQTISGLLYQQPRRDAILRVIKRIFFLRSCRKLPGRACLRYHLSSCSAPCVGAVSGEDYRLQVDRASALLRGKSRELLDQLRAEMAKHFPVSRNLNKLLSSATRSQQSNVWANDSRLSARRKLTRT